MKTSKIKVILFFPYIRTITGIKIGEFTFKAFDDIKKETAATKEELGRITSFFRQREARPIDVFNYLILEETKEELEKKFLELRRSLEIFRYLTVDPERKGLKKEHTALYVIFPKPDNPWRYKEEKHYMYQISEGFLGREHFVTYPHSAQWPVFYKDIYSDSPPHVDDKLKGKLEEGLEETDLRALEWYNKTFSTTAIDDKENLLRLSAAFESHFSLDEEKGKQKAIQKISKILSDEITESKLDEKIKEIKPYVTPMIVSSLAEAVKNRTSSDPITSWFKKHFYSVGSGIRHGDEVGELPKPVISKSKLGKSVWYAGDASHEFLNSVYFGQRLFKFLLEDKYYSYNKYIRQMSIEQLEELLVSDEERLKNLELAIKDKKIGEIKSDDIRISFSFRGTFYGDKERVLKILKRLLEEIKTKSDLWSEIAQHGEMLLKANLKEGDFSDFEKTKPFYYALIEIDSVFQSKWTSTEINEEEMKFFYIKQFISFAVQRLL